MPPINPCINLPKKWFGSFTLGYFLFFLLGIVTQGPFPCWDWALEAWNVVTYWDSFIKLFIYVSWFLFYYHICINWLFEHTCPHHLRCTWLECIRRLIKDSSHVFLAKWWVVHSRFMDLGNPSETITYHFLIRGMTCLGHWDGFHMVSALVCVMHTE